MTTGAMSDQERIERRRFVDNAVTAQHLNDSERADLEAYAQGDLSLDEVRARSRARDRTRNIDSLKRFYKGLGKFYAEAGLVIGGLVFLGAWLYCSITYGFLLGFGLGWLPSAILAWLATRLWPLALAALIIFWTPVFLFFVGVAVEIKSYFN